MTFVLNLEHGPYKTPSDTRRHASLRMITWTSREHHLIAGKSILGLEIDSGSRDCRRTERSAERSTGVDVDRRVGEIYQLCCIYGCIDCVCVAVNIV